MGKFLKLSVIFVLLFNSIFAQAKECRAYTNEQHNLLQLAYYLGDKYDLGLTLAAIVRQEAFVGDYVVRVNGQDGKHGSYGVTHVTLTTAMDLIGEDNVWRAKATIVPRLMSDDIYAMKLSLKKLLSVGNSLEGLEQWRYRVYKYNGAGKDARNYRNKIISHVKEFRRCNTFKEKVLDFEYSGKYTVLN